MPAAVERPRVLLSAFRERTRSDAVALANRFSYVAADPPLTDEDLRDYLTDPIAALPPSALALLPPVTVLLVPYLERGEGRGNGAKSNGKPARRNAPPEDWVVHEPPPESRTVFSAFWQEGAQAVVALAIDAMEVAAYHYELYRRLAELIAEAPPEEVLHAYAGIVREELASRMHGEVDEESWRRKEELLRRRSGAKDPKGFSDYARQSLIDTLTLYLHGICCDIDVETGPRQLPSRHLKRRLKLLQSSFPPPSGYAVFPEELDQIPPGR